MPMSLWSTNSVLSIASRNSMLSIGSVNSFGSIGSVASAGSFASWMSAGSVCSAFSAGTLTSTFAAGKVGKLTGCPATVDWKLASAVIGGSAVVVSLVAVLMSAGRCCADEIVPSA